MSFLATVRSLARSVGHTIADDVRAFAGPAEPLQREEPPDFATYCGRRTLLFARLVLLIAAGCLILFIPADRWLYASNPPLAERVVLFRLVSTGVLLAAYVALQRLDTKKLDPMPVVFAVFLALTVFIFGYMGMLSGPETPLVFQAIFVPCIVTVFLAPLWQRVSMSLLGCLFAGVAYYAPHPEYVAHANTGALAVLLLADAIACIAAGHMVFRLERVAFERYRDSREHAERLADLNRMKDSFVATVSHELRTPLNSVIGLTDALLSEPLSPESHRYARGIHDSGELLLLLVNDILDLAKLKAERVELDLIPLSLQDLVEATLGSFVVECAKKGIELSHYVPMDLPPIMGDPARLSRVLFNLVGNAIKFTPEGEIQIIAELDHAAGTPTLIITVRDTGIGVPPEKRELIFEEFTQADATVARKYGGTGLGLPIVRRLARLMGGDVTVGQNEPRGSAFTVRLPVTFGQPSGRNTGLTRALVPGKPPPELVVAIAHPLRRRHVTGMIEQRGFKVSAVATTAEAAQAATAAAAAGRSVSAILIEDPALTPDALEAGFAPAADKRPPPIILVLDPKQEAASSRYRAIGVTQLLHAPVRRAELRESLQRLLDPRAPRAEENASRHAPERQWQGRHKRILVVDDMPENRLLLEVFLKQAPVDATFAESGEQALEKFKHVRFDLAFVDIEMPGMDGYATVRQMRFWELSNGRTPIDIVALTAHSSREHQQKARTAGFTYHLVKPLRKQEFLAVTEILGEGEETLLMQAIAATAT